MEFLPESKGLRLRLGCVRRIFKTLCNFGSEFCYSMVTGSFEHYNGAHSSRDDSNADDALH